MRHIKLLTLIGLCLILAILPFMAACPAPPAAGEVIHWRFSTGFVPENAQGKVWQIFVNKVKEYTNGQLDIEILWGGAAGIPMPELISAFSKGQIEAGEVNPSIYPAELGNWISMPDILPWVTTNARQGLEIKEGVRSMYDDAFKKNNILLLALVNTTASSDTVPELVSTREIKELNDMQGMRIRVYPVLQKTYIWEPLGAKIMFMPVGEAYMSLKTGLLDGCYTITSQVLTSKLYEACPYLYVTSPCLGYGASTVVCSQKAFDALPVNVQSQLLKASKDTEKLFWDEIYLDPEKFGIGTDLSDVQEAQEKGMVVKRLPQGIIDKMRMSAKEGIGARAMEVGPDGEKFANIIWAALAKYPEMEGPVWDYITEYSK